MKAIKLNMIERNIKAKFLGIHEYYKDETTKDINEENLVDDIKKINPSMVVMVICYSQILHLRFLLEGAGIFSEVRLNRDLCLQSKGQILTLSETQKKFLQTLSQPENIEKKLVRIEGQVGSGKTLIGIEALKMKIAHYIQKYKWNATESKDKLRVLVIFDGFSDCAELKTFVEKRVTRRHRRRVYLSYHGFKAVRDFTHFSIFSSMNACQKQHCAIIQSLTQKIPTFQEKLSDLKFIDFFAACKDGKLFSTNHTLTETGSHFISYLLF